MKKIVLIPLAIFCIFSAKAQYATTVEMNPDTRAAGMAGSTIAGDASAFSIFGNTAGISFSDYKIAASYSLNMELSNDMMHSVAGYYRINSKHSVALGARYFGKAAQETTEDGVTYSLVKPYDAILDLGYAYAINDILSVGANVRGIQSSVADNAQGIAFGFDAGAYFRKNAWSAALTVSNLGTQLDYGEGGEFMPASVNAGGAYRYDIADKHRITANIQAGYRVLPTETSYLAGGVGLEYMYNGMIAVRGGYHISEKPDYLLGNYASAGLGVNVRQVVLDFAYLFLLNDTPADTSGSVWRASIGVRF
jgi:hypothetical protein